MDHSHDDEGIWDELNDQQSREIQQHHYRRDQARTAAGNNWIPPASAIGTAIRETAQQVTNAVVLGISGNPTAARYESLSSLLPPQSENIDNDLGMNLFGSGGRNGNNGNSNQNERAEPLLQPNQAHPTLAHARFNEHQPAMESNNNLHNAQQQQHQQQNNAYVFLQPFRLLPQRDGWGAVADLDVFFTSLYQYYYHRGFTTLALKGLVELITLFFTLGLSIFLFACLDWSALSSCTEETTCHANFSSYIIGSPFASHVGTSFAWRGWVFLYTTIFFCYGSFSVWSWWHALQHARAAKWFMEEQLGIGERKLQSGAVDWDRDVVAKIQQLQTSGQYRIAIHGQADETLDALLVAQRIMRKENFMVAIFNNPTLLDWSLPFAPGAVFFSKSLEWTVYFCILNFMFNHKYQLRPAFYLDANSLKRRFFLCGIAHVVFMPFLLFFMTLYFSLQNAYDWKSTQNYLGPREWSLAAKWTLREFNELPHLFEQRMEPSYDAAEKYLKLFRQHAIITAMGRVMVFIGGSLGAVLFAFAAINDAILLHVKIADWNLLWYAGVVAAIYSAGKAMLPSQEKENPNRTYHTNLSQEMDKALEQVAKHTHHYPDIWKGRGWDKTTTYKAFTKMYQYKAKLFVQELVSIVVAPYILCVSLPRCAEHVCEFILSIRAEVPGAGDMCGYCTFDFDTYGDELWEGKTFGEKNGGVGVQHQSPTDPHRRNLPPVVTGSLTESIMQSGTVEATQQFPIPRAKEGKMEKSFFSFKAAHPSWTCPESGQDLVDRLEEYQQEEDAALARERQVQIEAAARQLETLAHLERQRNARIEERPMVVDTSGMNDAYIGANVVNPPTAADAGAGLQLQQPPQRLAPVVEDQALGIPPQGPANIPARTLGQSHGMDLQASAPHVTSPEELQPPPPFAAPAPLAPGTSAGQNRHPTLDSASPSNLAPPPSIFPPPAASTHQSDSHHATADVGASRLAVGAGTIGSLALSTELHRILNMSTLDPDVGSVLAENVALQPVVNLARSMNGLPAVTEDRNRARERQYLLLERYHAHNVVASRQLQPGHHIHRQRSSPSQQRRQSPMSMSIAAGESPTSRNAAPPFDRMRNDRLGGSSLF